MTLCLKTTALLVALLSGTAVLAAEPSVSFNASESINAVLSGQSNRLTQVTVTEPNALVVWNKFDVPENHSVHFMAHDAQQHSVLNLIKGPANVIDGSISGINMNLYFVNPNGITFGRNSSVRNAENIYIGTAKLSSEQIKAFTAKGGQPISLNSMPVSKGMGSVKLLGTISSANIIVNGSKIIIEDPSLFSPTSNHTETDMPVQLELHSSTNRIDIGGDLDSFQIRYQNKRGTTRQYLHDVAHLSSTAEEGFTQFVDHSDEIALSSDTFLSAIQNDPHGQYWMPDDIVLENYTADPDLTFSGSLDGAYNSLRYTGSADRSTKGGLFHSLTNADIKNLQLFNCVWKTGASQEAVGALAGSIDSSTLSNVTVTNFTLEDIGQGRPQAIGALAGTITGNSQFSNVISSFSAETEQALTAGNYSFGTFAGSIEGTPVFTKIVTGVSHSLNSPALGNSSSVDVANSFAQAWTQAQAQGYSSDDLASDFIVTGEITGTDLSLRQKAFLKPFFIEDFYYVYDGKTHDYAHEVENKSYTLSDMVVLDHNAPLYAQKNAGDYDFFFTTAPTAQGLGHEYYFDYSSSADTYARQDNRRAQRQQSLHGYGSLDISARPLDISLQNQTIEHDASLSQVANASTLKNLTALNLADGETVDDLRLEFYVEDDGQTLNARSANKNYDLHVTTALFTRKPAPVTPPAPVDPVDPVDPIDPIDPVDPVDPVDPIDPVEPHTPVEPLDPQVPPQPILPPQPVVPDMPNIPEIPEIPEIDRPLVPELPSAQVKPELNLSVLFAKEESERKCRNCGLHDDTEEALLFLSPLHALALQEDDQTETVLAAVPQETSHSQQYAQEDTSVQTDEEEGDVLLSHLQQTLYAIKQNILRFTASLESSSVLALSQPESDKNHDTATEQHHV